jgi:hypothetical protein
MPTGTTSPDGPGSAIFTRVAQFSVSERTLLAAFAAAVRQRFGSRVRALQVFGSRARGDSHADSDIDVFVASDKLDCCRRRGGHRGPCCLWFSVFCSVGDDVRRLNNSHG